MVFNKLLGTADPSPANQDLLTDASAKAPTKSPDGGKSDETDNNEATPLIPNTDGEITDRQITFDIAGPGSEASGLYNDSPKDMTRSRKLAKFLSRFSWYYPKELRAHTNLDDAWAYFEHTTLSRYHIEFKEENSDDSFLKAEPGEKEFKTKLYPVLTTPEKDLADFGIGIGVYFYTLRMLAIIMFIAGLMSIPNLQYYYSKDYKTNPELSGFAVLQTSAVCTDQPWKACPTCTKSQWDYFPATFERYAEATTADGNLLTFIRTNSCTITEQAALVSYVVMIFVLVSIYILSKVTRAKEQFLDESQQTTSDYSVCVRNPPLDAKDAEEWREFFAQFGHVTSITIAYDNEELLTQLMLRRAYISQLEDLMPPGKTVNLDNLDEAFDIALPVPWYWKLYGTLDAKTLKKNIEGINKLIYDDLSQRDYDVSEIFAIYETESNQQAALQALQVAAIQVALNNTKALEKPEYVFRGKHVLTVVEPPEPSSVRWPDLDESWLQIMVQRTCTFFFTLFFIMLGCALVVYVRMEHGPVYAAFAVTFVTSAAPYICYYIIYYMESHPDEGSRQVSLYFKVTGFLWITTTLLTAKTTPFIETLDNNSDSLIPAMYAIFVTEMLKSPIIQLTDMFGNFYRHVLGPRAPNQKRMTNYFKVLFPAGYFLAAATLTVHYWVDKFCLLRVWKPAPAIGSEIARFSRTYFISFALGVYAIMSAFNFASFPYDNACDDDRPVPEEYVGTFDAVNGEGAVFSIEIHNGDSSYRFCDQDMFQYRPIKFPPIPSNQPPGGEWMSYDQENFAYIYGITSVVVVILVFIVVANRVRKDFRGVFLSPFEDHPTRLSPKKFSEIPDICAYIPGAENPLDPYPVLFCDITNIDHELIPWVDPKNPDYKVHNAIYDVVHPSGKQVFSTVHHWPPPKQS